MTDQEIADIISQVDRSTGCVCVASTHIHALVHELFRVQCQLALSCSLEETLKHGQRCADTAVAKIQEAFSARFDGLLDQDDQSAALDDFRKYLKGYKDGKETI